MSATWTCPVCNADVLHSVCQNYDAEHEVAELKEDISRAYDLGWGDAVKLYAVWRDGQQLVGIMEKPLKSVLKKGPPKDTKEISLQKLE